MNAEQWLADLEAKSLKARFILEHPPTGDPSAPVNAAEIFDNGMQLFFDATNPEAILRLVAMVRVLALRATDSTCPNEWRCAATSYDCATCYIRYACSVYGTLK